MVCLQPMPWYKHIKNGLLFSLAQSKKLLVYYKEMEMCFSCALQVRNKTKNSTINNVQEVKCTRISKVKSGVSVHFRHYD